MPFHSEFKSAELFYSYGDVSIYLTYKDDEMSTNPPRDFWFVLDDQLGEADAFDVRDLKAWQPEPHPPFLIGTNNTEENKRAWEKYYSEKGTQNHVKKVLRLAIDSGELKPYQQEI